MSREAAYFEALYAGNPDPWGFETSPYEQAKYGATLAALPDRQFAMALEVGCSIGVFTRLLAEKCDRLLALDVSPTALRIARARCAGLAHVAIEQRRLPDEWPHGRYHLIVFSEVLYFLDAADIDRAAALAQQDLAEGGCIVLVNWRGETGTSLSGEAAAERFVRRLPERLAVRTEREPGYRLDLVRG